MYLVKVMKSYPRPVTDKGGSALDATNTRIEKAGGGELTLMYEKIYKKSRSCKPFTPVAVRIAPETTMRARTGRTMRFQVERR